MAKTVVHVGLGKTGTSALQERVFVCEPSLVCLGRPNHTGAEYAQAFHFLTRAEANEIDWPWLEQFFGGARDAAERIGGAVILSDEALAPVAPMQSLLAERLHRACPDAQIVLTLRNQPGMIVSFYRNHGRHLKWAPPSFANHSLSFGEWLDFELDRLNESFLGVLRYDRLVQIYEDVFGRDRVHVLLYEEMFSDPVAYASRWASLLDIDRDSICERLAGDRVNVTPTDRQIAYDDLRKTRMGRTMAALVPFRSLFAPVLKRTLAGGGRNGIQLDEAQLRRVRDVYGADNASLDTRRQLGLRGFGYPMAA